MPPSKLELTRSLLNVDEMTHLLRTCVDLLSLHYITKVEDIIASNDLPSEGKDAARRFIDAQKEQIHLEDMLASTFLSITRARSGMESLSDDFSLNVSAQGSDSSSNTYRYHRVNIPGSYVNIVDKTAKPTGTNGDIARYVVFFPGKNKQIYCDGIFDGVTHPFNTTGQGEKELVAKLDSYFSQNNTEMLSLITQSIFPGQVRRLPVSSQKLATNIDKYMHQPLIEWNEHHAQGPQGAATGSISLTTSQGSATALWGDQRVAYANLESKDKDMIIWQSPSTTENTFFDTPTIDASLLAVEQNDNAAYLEELRILHQRGVVDGEKYNGQNAVGVLGRRGQGDFLSCVKTADFRRPETSIGYVHAGWTDGFEMLAETAGYQALSVLMLAGWIFELEQSLRQTDGNRSQLFILIPHALTAYAVNAAINNQLPRGMERRGKRAQDGTLVELKLDDATHFYRRIGRLPPPRLVSQELVKMKELYEQYDYLKEIAIKRRDRLINT